MTLEIIFATAQDAVRIADIHMAAFADNGMLLAQFPSPAIREGLRNAIMRKANDDIRDPHTAVLLVRDTHSDNTIISFAKWNLPSSTTDNESPWVWPNGTRVDILNHWTEKVENTMKKILGDEPCYRKMFTTIPR